MAAVATGYLTQMSAWGHLNVVMRISEEARVTNVHHVALAVSYGEMMRKNWAARAKRCDPDLSIETEAWRIDKEILETAQSRLSQVVVAAGLKASYKNSGESPSSSFGT